MRSGGVVEDEQSYFKEENGQEDAHDEADELEEDPGPLGDWSGRVAAARRPAVPEHFRLGHKSKRFDIDNATKAHILRLHREDPVTFDDRGLRRKYPYLKLRAIRAILAHDGLGFEEDDDAFVAASDELAAELTEMEEAAYGFGDDLFADVGLVGEDDLVEVERRSHEDIDDDVDAQNDRLLDRAELERERAEVQRAWADQGFLQRPKPFDISDPNKPRWADPGRFIKERKPSDVAFLPTRCAASLCTIGSRSGFTLTLRCRIHRPGDAATALDRDAKREILIRRRPIPPASVETGRKPRAFQYSDRPSRSGPERLSSGRSPRAAGRGGGNPGGSAFGLRPSNAFHERAPALAPVSAPALTPAPAPAPALIGGPYLVPPEALNELRRKRHRQAKHDASILQAGTRSDELPSA